MYLIFYYLVVINPTVYIKWLLKQFLNLGGRIERKRIDDLTQAMENVDSVVNCTGFQARDLVKDDSVVPVRGHNVLVRAPHIRKTMTMDSKYKEPAFWKMVTDLTLFNRT